jgi:hypothetical protein
MYVGDQFCYPLKYPKLPFGVVYTQIRPTGLLQKEMIIMKLNICFVLFVRWDFGYCGHYWPIVPAPDDR